MTDITTLPIDELLDDLIESAKDIAFCTIAERHGITTYSGGEVVRRRKANEQIVTTIRAELTRRVLSGQGQEAG